MTWWRKQPSFLTVQSAGKNLLCKNPSCISLLVLWRDIPWLRSNPIYILGPSQNPQQGYDKQRLNQEDKKHATCLALAAGRAQNGLNDLSIPATSCIIMDTYNFLTIPIRTILPCLEHIIQYMTLLLGFFRILFYFILFYFILFLLYLFYLFYLF